MSQRDNQFIAVIGMGARMPGAPDVQTFFRNICDKVNSITDVPPDRWDPAVYWDPDPKAPDKTYSRIGGFLDAFTPPLRKWRIPPMVARSVDDTQLLALDVTEAALADAGLTGDRLPRERCAVILGNAIGGDLRETTSARMTFRIFEQYLQQTTGFAGLSEDAQQQVLAELRQKLDTTRPAINEDTMAGELSNVVAGRVASAYKLTGPNYTVDAACASSLAALSASVGALRNGECDMAITGGVDRNMCASGYVKFCKTRALSGRGSTPFDERADGFVMGEGGAVLILKRLDDAVADGDRIRAVIRGVGGSSDGGAKGLTAPSVDGQLLCLRRAYEDAGVEPQTVGLIEAHGTSTRVGDAAEVETLCRLLKDTDLPGGPVALSSVKSNIGHLKSAAGAASLVKAVLALEQGVLPPTAGFETPIEALRGPDVPVRVQTELEDWVPAAGLPRRAGVSAFGFGGTNFHVVLEEHQPQVQANAQADASDARVARLQTRTETASYAQEVAAAVTLPEVGLLRLGAPSREALARQLRVLRDQLQQGETFESLTIRWGQPVYDAAVRAAITAADAEELTARIDGLARLLDTGKGTLKLAGAGTFLGEGPAPEMAFLFPGQGSQYVDMLGDLLGALPSVGATLAEADAVMAPILGRPLSDYLFGRVSVQDEAHENAAAMALQQTAVTQPAVLAADVAMLRVLADLGLAPDVVAGHSLGEYAACVAAGVMPLDRALRIVAARGREMTGCVPEGNDPGQMAVVAAPAEQVAELLGQVDGYVVAANKNCPSQTVIAGASDAVQQAMASFESAGLRCLQIPVSHAFHSRVVSAASAPLREVLEREGIRPARRPIYSNVTADLYPTGEEEVLDLLARQVASPVEWIGIIERMYERGVRTFVEIGPKKALAAFTRDILAKRPHRAIHTNHPKKGGPRSLVEALALLSADGQTVGATRLAGKQATRDQTSVPADRQTHAQTDAPRTPQVAAQAPASPPETPVWITGVAAGLPGGERLFDDGRMDELLAGQSLLDRLDGTAQQAIVDQRIERLVKSADGTGTLETVDRPEEVMSWVGRGGTVDLVEDYRLPASWDKDRDATTRMGVAAAFEVLRDAWLPLVEQRRAVSGGRTLGEGFRLPAALGGDTGVIFASAFPGYEKLLELAGRDRTTAPFPRNTLLQILGLGHAHIAELLGAFGPNTLINAACSSTTTAVAIAQDWIRCGRCARVVVVGADNVTSPTLLPWIGGGFLALGAATTERELDHAAVPFGRRRNGMIIGMGAVALLVESAESAQRRGVRPRAEIVATRLANSASHPLRLRPDHIAAEVDALVEAATTQLGVDRRALARDLVFMSHETFTPARGGSAQAEVDALRRAFGSDVGEVLVVNTKGYTGHAMAAGIEDAAVVAGLWSQSLPPVANLHDPDPEFADLTFHQGGPVQRRYALRLAAGFGSQIALTLYRRPDGEDPRVDEPVFRDFLAEQCGMAGGAVVRDRRLLRGRTAHRVPDETLADALTLAQDRAQETQEIRKMSQQPNPAVPSTTTTVDEVLARLQAVVAERTGYDLEELEPDLELEADLGIDTVKQAEIVGELREAYHLERDESFRLADYPTLEALADYVVERVRPSGAVEPAPEHEHEHEHEKGKEIAPVAIETDLGDGFRISQIRFTPGNAEVSAPAPEPRGRILVVGSSIDRASKVAEGLVGHDARIVYLPSDRLLSITEEALTEELTRWVDPEPLQGVINLLAWEHTPPAGAAASTALFRLARALERCAPATAGQAPVSFLLTVLSLQGDAQTGGCPTHETARTGALAGLTRALSREWTGARVRVVGITDPLEPEDLGALLARELRISRRSTDVVWRDDSPHTLQLGGPLEATPIALDGATVLITGGSGGLGALLARRLADQGCRLVLTGLDALPETRTAAPPSRAEIREGIKAEGTRPTPALINRELARHDREQALATLVHELTQAGATVRYLRADLTDETQMHGMVADLRQHEGHLDVVLHAAGLERSRPLLHKPMDEFETVFGCKATAGERLWSEIQDQLESPPRRFVAFSSVAGLFGNAGQTDYASANASLTGLVTEINRTEPRTAALSVHWTGWDDVGMTANSPIRDLLIEHGVQLLPPDLGARIALELLGCNLAGEVLVAGSLGELAGASATDLAPTPAAETPRAPTPAAETPRAPTEPALSIVRDPDGQRATLRMELSPDAPWLADHAVDGVPLLPAVAGLEIMARAAASLVPGTRVTGLRNARFHRPLKVQPGRRITAIVEASLNGSPCRVRTALTSERVNRAGRVIHQDHFTAEIETARDEAQAPETRPPLHLGTLDRHGPESEEIYRHFFHGPAFQVLETIRLVGSAGLVARGRGKRLALDDDHSRLAPLAIEAALQAAGFHALLHERSQGLPAAIGQLSLTGAPADLEGAQELVLRVRAAGSGADPDGILRHRFDVDVLDAQGGTLMVCRDVVLIQRAAADEASLPSTSALLEVVEIAVDSLGRPDAKVVDLEAELGPAERRQAVDIAHPGRRLDWIAGRLAAKELVRLHLRDRYGVALPRRQVEVATDPGGAPVPWVPARPGLAALLPAISITHACGRALALGVPISDPGVRVGVDLAPVEARPDSFEKQWLTDGERRLLDGADTEQRTLLVSQLWALKEAASKALGLGLQLSTSELEIESLDPDGTATLRFNGMAQQRFGDLGATRIRAAVLDWHGAVLAWARLDLGGDTDTAIAEEAPPLQGLRETHIQPTR